MRKSIITYVPNF